MFWFTVQFAILLLAAYFAGAMLGCMMRRTFFPHTLQSETPRRVPVAVPVSVPASAPTGAPTVQPTRFERALTGGPAPAAPAAPIAQPVAQPAPAAPQPVAPRVVPAPAAVPAAPIVAAPSVNAAVTAAMTAVAAAARSQQQPAGILPAAMGTSGPATVSAPSGPIVQPPAERADLVAPVAVPAPVATPAPAPVAPVAAAPVAAPQDLTRIRAIDDAMQKALNGLGVKSFADIAGWKPDDVNRIAGALKIPGRIEQENWIEQAQILAKGGETYYSRRKLKGELPTGRPTPDEGERITVRVPAPMRPAEVPAASAPVAVAAAPAASSAAAPAASSAAAPAASSAAAQAASAVQAAQAVASAAPAAAATAAAVAVAAAAAKIAAPEAPSAPPAAVTPATSAPAIPASAAVTPVAQAAPVSDRPIGMARDNLQRIAGINSEVERLLNVQGVTRYGQIADWTPSDISRFDRLLGFEGRIARENWIEQSQILSKGGETAYARDYSRRTTEAARPARLADAIQARAADKPAIAAPAAVERKEDLSVLRSVRSEAYRGTDSAAANAGAGRPGDDLKRIRGVGVLIEKKLNALGVTRYDQVANWTQSDIERFSEKLDFNGRIERENWVEQARILSAGGQTEFSQRVDRGEVETSRPKS